MAQEAAGWHPPNAQELLEQSIPDGLQWYELRLPLKTLSYTIDRWDDALKDAKALGRVFKGELYHCHKEDGRLEAQRVW
jgi:hypothetical protein